MSVVQLVRSGLRWALGGLLGCGVALLASCAAVAPSSSPSAATATVTAAPPVVPSAAGRVPVAQVGKLTIYRDEVPPQGLADLIVPVLIDGFVAENRLTVTEAEIAQFNEQALGEANPGRTPQEREQLRQTAVAMLRDWKVCKALYERYGGVVVFQQGRPLAPVGAMRAFLESREEAGAFRVFDAAARSQLYEGYLRPQTLVVPPSAVNFDQPWWVRRNSGR